MGGVPVQGTGAGRPFGAVWRPFGSCSSRRHPLEHGVPAGSGQVGWVNGLTSPTPCMGVSVVMSMSSSTGLVVASARVKASLN
jgi:hypothetical protein